MVSYNDLIMQSIGKTGAVQWLILIGCHNLTIIGAWAMIAISYSGAEPRWWSEMRVWNATSNTSDLIKSMKTCPHSSNETLVYGDELVSTVSEWGLVCERDWIPSLITSTQMFGALIGSIIGGQLAEFIGRKRTLVLMFSTFLVFTLASAFARSWQLLAACTALIGASLGGMLVNVYVLPMEYLSTRWRTLVAMLPFWSLGVALFGALSLVVNNWRHIAIITASCGVPFLFVLLLLPESCRWLLTRGRHDDARAVLTRLARWNRRPVPDFAQLEAIMRREEEDAVQTSRVYTYLDIFKQRRTIIITALFGVQWFSCGFVYYGLTFGISALSGNASLNFALAGITEAFSCLLCLLVSRWLGRRWTTMLFLSASGVIGLVIAVMHATTVSASQMVSSGLALTSRLALASAWQSVTVYTSEYYPTVLRAAGNGCGFMLARVGSILAPQMNYLGKSKPFVAFAVYGGLAVLSALTCLLLRDTYSDQLEDYLDGGKAAETAEIQVHEKNGCVVSDERCKKDSNSEFCNVEI